MDSWKKKVLEYFGPHFVEIMDRLILGWTLHLSGARMVLFSFKTVNWWAKSSTPNSWGGDNYT